MTEREQSPPPRMKGRGIQAAGERAKDSKGAMVHLLQYLMVYKASVGIVILFATCSSIFSIVESKILGKATTRLFEGIIAQMMDTGLFTDLRYIRNCLLLLVVLYLISVLFSYLQSYIMSSVSMEVTCRFHKNISGKISRLPLGYYDTRTHGEVLSRITDDVDTMNQTLSQNLTQIITSMATLAGMLAMMISISIRITLATIMVLPLSMGLIMGVVKKSQKYFKGQQKSLGRLNGHIEGVYGDHNVVQVFNGKEEAIETSTRINNELYSSAWESQFLSGMMMPIMSFISNLGYVSICLLGGYFTIKRVIDIGDIQVSIQYMRIFTQPITQIANISNTLQFTATAAERVFEFLDEQEEVPKTASPIRPQQVRGDVEFRHVHFGYRPDKLIIHDFSSSVRSGQTIAIVGPTGAGETTMIKLLMWFYELNSGSILIDGHDIPGFTRNDPRSMFSMVLQETWLYSASITENMRYGSFDKTDEEVIAAAKATRCDTFIRSMPEGYQMVVNEETSNPSQDQKQLLTIARTILANPRIPTLDEATSSIDARTEVLIQNTMNNLMQNRASFVIAHRLSTIRDTDLILVTKDGDIIGQGSHMQPSEKRSFYTGLYQSRLALNQMSSETDSKNIIQKAKKMKENTQHNIKNEEPVNQKGRPKEFLYPLLSAVVIIGCSAGYYIYSVNTNYFSTDNAKVTAELYSIMSVINRKLVSQDVGDGDLVEQDQVLERQETLLYITSPISDTMVKNDGAVDQMMSASTPMAVMADTSNLYVGVNVRETDIMKIRLDQMVNVKIDAYPKRTFKGQVTKIDPTTQTYFTNTTNLFTGGAHTKMTQLTPVEATIENKENLPLVFGMDATVRAHLK